MADGSERYKEIKGKLTELYSVPLAVQTGNWENENEGNRGETRVNVSFDATNFKRLQNVA